MEKNKKIYTDEENIQILIALLKEHDIRKVIINPGATNVSLVTSIQCDDFFEKYSCVDERSAAYMACGLAEESNEPVVLTCTGATASRNYIPGLTEAFYNKIPIIAVTATQYMGRVNQNVAQVLDRSVQLKDIVKKSVQLNIVHSQEDKWAANLKINDILLECRRDGGGPVHVNMETSYSNNLISGEIPKQRVINRYTTENVFPIIENKKKVAIFIGNHMAFDDKLTKEIETFCKKYNAIVLCDHTSNYNGKYKILGNLLSSAGKSDFTTFDLMIDIGNITGSYMNYKYQEIWRVNPDGEIRDTYKRITKVFEMSELTFFSEYNKKSNIDDTKNYDLIVNEDKRLREKLNNLDLPFSNLYIAKIMIDRIEEGSIIHLAILNTLRAWNYYSTNKKYKFYSNTGGFGIDGILSTAIGTSLATDKNVYCFIGDLAFFYDLNSIGNKHVKNNLRIMLINNGCGTEFHNYNHRAAIVTSHNNISTEYVAADGHFGNKSKNLVKHYAEDLGFKYLSANNKEEFHNNISEFLTDKSEKPIVFEIFTNPEDESNALKKVNQLEITTETVAKSVIKSVLGEKGVNFAKKIIKKQ